LKIKFFLNFKSKYQIIMEYNNNLNIRDRIINNNNSGNKALTDQDMTKINNEYIRQINEIFSKILKMGLILVKIYTNNNNSSYLNFNPNNNII